MLKISKTVRHTTIITCGCPLWYQSTCGVMYRQP